MYIGYFVTALNRFSHPDGLKGKLRIEHDFHVGGLFTLNNWRKLLKQDGFKVYEEKDVMTPGVPTFIFVKHKLKNRLTRIRNS